MPSDRNFLVVGSDQAVRYYHVAVCAYGIESVVHSGVEVVDCIRAAARVEGVAVSEEDFRSQAAQQVHYGGGIVGADVGEVAGLSEVDLDGGEPALEINALDAGPFYQPDQLGHHIIARSCPQVGEIDF